MKTVLFLVSLIISSQAFASGWMDVTVQKGTVVTKSGDGVLVIMREKDSLPPTGYECHLNIKITEEKLQEVAVVTTTGSWTRYTLTQDLPFSDSYTSYVLRLDANRGSGCLQWGDEYYEEGHWTRDCLEYADHFRTMKSILELRASNGTSAVLSCEKWMSDKKLERLDDFFHVLRRSVGNFPLFLDLELD